MTLAQGHCEECSKPIVASRMKRFCSKPCRMLAWRRKTGGYQKRTGEKLNAATTGAINELLVGADLLKRGYSVFRSLSPACVCDLAILKDGKLFKVEVRAAYHLGNGQTLFTKRKRDDHDILALVFNSDTIEYTPPFS